MSPEVRAAHDLLTRLLVTLRLVAPDAQEPAAMASCALIARALRLPDWPAVLATLTRMRETVTACWQESVAWKPFPM